MNTLTLQTAQLSAPGGRAVNEDAVGVADCIWVLADGLGGHGGGEMASKVAVEAAINALAEQAFGPSGLREAIAAAHQAVLDNQQQSTRMAHMRTTLVVLCSDGHSACWAHVGDSRLYGFRDGVPWIQTLDHSVPQVLAQAGEITPAQIRGHEDRNRLLRCLGQENPPKPAVLDEPITLQPGDVFLLCSDGFWEWVDEEVMQQTLAQADTPKAWLAAMEAHLLAHAEPGHDNYSAIAVFVAG